VAGPSGSVEVLISVMSRSARKFVKKLIRVGNSKPGVSWF
jgi:hypothetical protein